MGNKLREYRIKKGLSQEELAQKSGVSRVTISNIETGFQVIIKSATMEKLAEALEMSPKTIFF